MKYGEVWILKDSNMQDAWLWECEIILQEYILSEDSYLYIEPETTKHKSKMKRNLILEYYRLKS